jgi:plasmid stabilization system protein ParE
MTGFALHPEAFTDLDEIRAYIADDNPVAAASVISEIFDAIRACAISTPRLSTPGPDDSYAALQSSARILDCLRTG